MPTHWNASTASTPEVSKGEQSAPWLTWVQVRSCWRLPWPVFPAGRRRAVGLAAIMLSRFDVTLLDEPTNDLDFLGLEHLEKLVVGLPGGLVVVSHDREFLSRTVNAVLEIDPHTRTANLYGGSWDSYLQEKATVSRHREESYEKSRQTREDLLSRAQRERQWATSGTRRERKAPRDNDKAQRDFRITGPSSWRRAPGAPRKRWSAWKKSKNHGSPGN